LTINHNYNEGIMPVIRLTTTATVFKREEYEAMVAQLAQELAGEATEQGPVVFEIQLDGMEKFDALVVWEKWKGIPSRTRSEMIQAAYKEKKDKIAQPLGVTYKEAIDQNLLPYAVVPLTRKGEARPEALKEAMKKYGAFELPGEKVDLRLPTMNMAREVHRKLIDELPMGYWSIVQLPDPNF
jgi:hypothetical protein